jgi:CBS domain-containing protein
MKQALVKDWMTANPICATPQMTLPEAHRLMMQHNIRRLPVVENGLLVGIVTRGDIRGAQPSEATSLSIFELHYLIGMITLDRIMTRNPVTCSANATIYEAAKIMLQHKIAGLPVVDDAGKVIGIITESDIFRLVVGAWEKEEVQEPV